MKFTSLLKQSHRYLVKFQEPDTTTKNLQREEDLGTAIRILRAGLNQFNYSVSYLFNIAVLLTIKGELTEALLILHKLHRHKP